MGNFRTHSITVSAVQSAGIVIVERIVSRQGSQVHLRRIGSFGIGFHNHAIVLPGIRNIGSHACHKLFSGREMVAIRIDSYHIQIGSFGRVPQ